MLLGYRRRFLGKHSRVPTACPGFTGHHELQIVNRRRFSHFLSNYLPLPSTIAWPQRAHTPSRAPQSLLHQLSLPSDPTSCFPPSLSRPLCFPLTPPPILPSPSGALRRTPPNSGYTKVRTFFQTNPQLASDKKKEDRRRFIRATRQFGLFRSTGFGAPARGRLPVSLPPPHPPRKEKLPLL